MASQDIFSKFCKYVDDSIFSKENVGEMVSFMIDQTFINEFCVSHEVSEKMLMNSVGANLFNSYLSHFQVKGILAIQLYAATKRQRTEDITERNYRERLSQVLNWDIQDMQRWMSDHQIRYWQTLYDWCDKQGYLIAKCKPKQGAGRFVQYPVQQAKRIFTEEDLKYISYHFVEKKILPNEDLSQSDFWRILGEHRIDSYVHTNHGRELIGNLEYRKDAYRQIFNYYLRWDGSFTDIYKQKSSRVQKETCFLYLSDDYTTLDVRNESLKVEQKILIKELSLKKLESFYRFKRRDIILFKRNDIYENYWEETRYLEDDEEGVAIVFKNDKRYYFNQKYPLQEFNRHKPICEFQSFDIFEISHLRGYNELYTERRFYSLEGGLKVGRRQYLNTAPPILKLEKSSFFLIDGEESPHKPKDGYLLLNFLSIGKHSIKFPNHKKLEFEIVHCDFGNSNWQDDYNKWIISKKENCWESSTAESGIVGLDFSCVKMDKQHSSDKTLLNQWALLHQGVHCEINNKNVALKLLSNSNGNRI